MQMLGENIQTLIKFDLLLFKKLPQDVLIIFMFLLMASIGSQLGRQGLKHSV